ncbi:MAG TPA: aldo/keto reductase [bacterium]|nr:aldo/keto reductase [bacterium]
MEYTQLGRTGLKVSRLCLGTMNWPWLTTEPEAYDIMDRSLEVGINFFDSANIYGGKMGEGLTEQVIGRWFRQGGGRREKVVLATKVYNPMGEWPNQRGLSALHIRQACEDSLKRLHTDHIDLYQMHHVDRSTPWEEIWQAMQQLVQAGKVIYVGSSNFAGWHIAQANEAAKSRNFMGLVCEQTRYNLLCRTPELEVVPACEGYGVGLIPWGPLMGGVLAGAAAKAKSGRRGDANAARDLKKNLSRVQAYERYCAKQKVDPAQLALAWLLHQKVVTAPIIGPRTVGQVDTALKALKLKLSSDVLKKLDEIFPGPGAPAPEAYAW